MNVPLEDLDESGVRDFLGRDPGVVHNLERSTIRRLVVVLREVGVLRAKQPATLTAVQSHVAEYRRYLIQQRGLAEACLAELHLIRGEVSLRSPSLKASHVWQIFAQQM